MFSRAANPQDVRGKALKAIERLPTLSPMIGKLMLSLARRDCEVSDLAELIQRDPTLTAHVLKVANSGLYARMQRIVTVRHAISLVGLNTLRRYALTHTAVRLFSRLKPANSFAFPVFNLHSTATGLLTDLLAQHLPVEHGMYAFMAGLMHDVGRLALAVAAPETYDGILAVASMRRMPVVECEREIAGTDHAELSAEAVQAWHMPKEIVSAVRDHHHPQADEGPLRLPRLLQEADAWVNASGISLTPLPDVQPKLVFRGYEFPRAEIIASFETDLDIMADLIGYHGVLIRRYAAKDEGVMRQSTIR